MKRKQKSCQSEPSAARLAASAGQGRFDGPRTALNQLY